MLRSSLTFITLLIIVPAAADADGLAARVEAVESEISSLDSEVGALDSELGDLESRIERLEETPPRVLVLVDAEGEELGVFESGVCLLLDSPMLSVIKAEVRGTSGGKFRFELLQFESNDCTGEAFVQFDGNGSPCVTSSFIPEARVSAMTGRLVIAQDLALIRE